MLFFRKATIHANAVALIVVWKKAFGEEHVMTKTSVIKKLEKLVKSYITKSTVCFTVQSPDQVQSQLKRNHEDNLTKNGVLLLIQKLVRF